MGRQRLAVQLTVYAAVIKMKTRRLILIILVEVIPFYQIYQQGSVMGVRGITTAFQTTRPTFIIFRGKFKQRRITRLLQKTRMVFVRLFHAAVFTELLIPRIIVLQDVGSLPCTPAFNAEMIVGLPGQCACPGSTFQ